jgi:hypothetical protein
MSGALEVVSFKLNDPDDKLPDHNGALDNKLNDNRNKREVSELSIGTMLAEKFQVSDQSDLSSNPLERRSDAPQAEPPNMGESTSGIVYAFARKERKKRPKNERTTIVSP